MPFNRKPTSPKKAILLQLDGLQNKIKQKNAIAKEDNNGSLAYFNKSIEFIKVALKHPALNENDLKNLASLLCTMEKIIDDSAKDDATKQAYALELANSSEEIRKTFAESRFQTRALNKKGLMYAIGQTLSVLMHLGILAAGIVIPIVCFPTIPVFMMVLFFLVIGLKGQILPGVIFDIGLNVWDDDDTPIFSMVNELERPASALCLSNYNHLFPAADEQLTAVDKSPAVETDPEHHPNIETVLLAP